MLYVVKRDGHHEIVQFDKITERVNRLINPVELRNMDLPYLNLNKETLFLDPGLVAQKVVASLYPGITTEELDIESANICINLSTTHPSYSYLGGRILVSNLHKKTSNKFSEKMILLSKETNNLDSNWLQYVVDNAEALDNIIDYNRDYIFDYFAFKTLEKAYLLKSKGKIIERPQDTLLRTAITLQMGNIELIKQTYNYMSMGYYTHASPTLFNSGTKHMQLSSCFVEGTEVLTSEGIKKIEDVKIGDQVCTHMGRYKKVLQLHTNSLNERHIMELNVHRTKPIKVTNNHKFWSITPDDKEPKWRSVDEMNINCKIAMPSYKSTENEIDTLQNRNILAFISGYYISNGFIVYNDNMFELYFYGDHNIINCIETIVLDLYNILPSKYSHNNTIVYNNLDFINLIINILDIKFKKSVGIYEEKINFNVLLNWNNQMINYFVKGLFAKETIRIDKYEYGNNLYHILRTFGHPVSFDRGHNTLNLSLHTKDESIEIINGVNFLKIKEIKETELKPVNVYTLGIEDDHSYNVEGLICQNCFLLGTNDDLHDIATTWNSCAQISKWAGGIGLHVSNIRGKDSLINGTGGRTNGLVPFLKIFNEIARWIDQGGKRPGSIAIYLEPHHPDIFEFLDLRKNFGSETERARDLFLALWISDLFMKQVDSDSDWYLLSSDECPRLNDVYGEEYEALYWQYVNQGLARKKVSARKLWMAILESQIETGMPYISYKDHVNRKCNQKNIGTIKSSNLCNEITEYSDHNEYAVCNLASIALKSFVRPFDDSNIQEWIIYTKPNCKYCTFAKNYLTNLQYKFVEIPHTDETVTQLKTLLGKDHITFPQIFIKENNNFKSIGGWSDLYTYYIGKFDFDKLYEVAYLATINLDKVIDVNYYPVPQAKLSNMKHRPVGLGIQGLADALVLMRIPFDSEEAVKLNSQIMETIYMAAIDASSFIAQSRQLDMNTLIEYFKSSYYPDFYESNFTVYNNDIINKLYHKLRPNKYELDREPGNSTGAYSTFNGSPFSKGLFQFDLWNKQPENIDKWQLLRERVMKYGTRNSLLTSLMPTASTSQILGNNECFEFFTNNIYTRKTQSGDFMLVNKYLVNDLINIGLWNNELKDMIIAANGSIQGLDTVPQELKNIYKTVWEIKQVWVLKAAAARGPFVDQTQSMNIFMAEPDYQRLSSSHFWGWKNGLKTGMYYLRTRPAVNAVKFTINPELIKKEEEPCHSCSA